MKKFFLNFSNQNLAYKSLYIFRIVYLFFVILCSALIYLAANADMERIKLDAAADFSSRVQSLEAITEHLENLATMMSHFMSYSVEYNYENKDYNIVESFQLNDEMLSLKYINDNYQSGLYIKPPINTNQHRKIKLLLKTGAYLPHILQEERIESIAIYYQSPQAKVVYPDMGNVSNLQFKKELKEGYWQSFWLTHQEDTVDWRLVTLDGINKLALSVSILTPAEGLVGIAQFIFPLDVFDQDIYQPSGPDSIVFLSEISTVPLLIATTQNENNSSAISSQFDMKKGLVLPNEVQSLLKSIDGWLYQSDDYFLLSVPISGAFNLVYLTDAKDLAIFSSNIFKYGVGLLIFVLFMAFYIERILHRNLTLLKQQDDILIGKNKLLVTTLSTLETTQQELIQKEKIASLGGVVAGLAHQLNTPLGIAITANSYINEATEKLTNKLNQGLKKSELTSFFDNIKESSRLVNNNLSRATGLVNNFKLLATDESEDEQCLFNVVEYTQAILLGFKLKFEERRIKSEVYSEQAIEINNYPVSYTQIIVQLINNALSHGLKDDGHIRIEIYKSSKFNGVLINIIDDGKGIDKEEIDRIFEPFFTSECSADKIGLGLTITHNLVLGKMRGEIKVSSVLDEGCCFSLHLPNLSLRNTIDKE